MLPISTIIIKKNGNSEISGEEQSDQCHKLSDLAASAGKVEEDKDKDHTPLYQSVHRKGN